MQKIHLKNLIPLAKAVGAQAAGQEKPSDISSLKKEISELVDSCELMIYNLRLQDDDIMFFQEKKREDFSIISTGNAELDSMISGLNTFGLAPELAEMMKMASNMEPVEYDDEKPTGASNSGVDPYKDDALDSLLANLNNAMDGLDFGEPKKLEQTTAWNNSDLERCAQCFDLIQGKLIQGLNKFWHPHCYFCTQCGINLEGQPADAVYEGPKGMPYCYKDFYPLCPKCPVCSLNILPKDSYPAFKTVYHKNCWKCQTCGGKIDGPSFEINFKPQCELCYHQQQGTMCAECSKPIYGSALTVLGKKETSSMLYLLSLQKNINKRKCKSKK